jgi:hypothetical protein
MCSKCGEFLVFNGYRYRGENRNSEAWKCSKRGCDYEEMLRLWGMEVKETRKGKADAEAEVAQV